MKSRNKWLILRKEKKIVNMRCLRISTINVIKTALNLSRGIHTRDIDLRGLLI